MVRTDHGEQPVADIGGGSLAALGTPQALDHPVVAGGAGDATFSRELADFVALSPATGALDAQVSSVEVPDRVNRVGASIVRHREPDRNICRVRPVPCNRGALHVTFGKRHLPSMKKACRNQEEKELLILTKRVAGDDRSEVGRRSLGRSPGRQPLRKRRRFSKALLRFLGLSLADPVPDANTIWALREALKRVGAVERRRSPRSCARRTALLAGR